MADAYQIVAQHQSQTVDAAGGLRDVMVVTFRTPDGSQGSVRVPLEEYNAATVAQLVRQRAAAIAAVADL